jgi:hypothetical protein
MEHRLLTGNSLHEPKGVETATNGQVYVANGAGSGTWRDIASGNNYLNKFVIVDSLADVSAPSSIFQVVPNKANLTRIYTVLGGSITTANSVLTIYKNNVAQTPTITIPFTGSGPGVKTSTAISPVIAFAEGDVIEIRSDGGSSGTQTLAVTLSFVAVN